MLKPRRVEFVNIVDHFNYVMMVKNVCSLNESRGKLKDVEKKEHKPKISEWVEVLVMTISDIYDIL